MTTPVRKFSQKKKLNITNDISNYAQRLSTVKDESLNCKKEDLSNKFDTAVLVFAGDWHIGVPDFDINSAIKTIEYVLNTPNAIMFLMGDMLNTAIVGAISNNFEDLLYPQDQWRVFLDLFTQVAMMGKLTVIHEGNHERRVEKPAGINQMAEAARAMEDYDDRGNWSQTQKLSAPFYAQRNIVLMNKDIPSKQFETIVISHHGDGAGNVNGASKLQWQNMLSSINVIGHLHKYSVQSRTIEIMNNDGQSYKHRVLDIVLPSNGDGNYGNVHMYNKKNNAPAIAIELTSTKNPLFDENSTARVKEFEYIPAFRSIPLNSIIDSKKKQQQINIANRVISKKRKEIQNDLQEKFTDLIQAFKDSGMTLTDEISNELDIWFEKTPNKPVETKTKIKKIEELAK